MTRDPHMCDDVVAGTPVTPILGIPYREQMGFCASIGSLSSLREMVDELECQGALTDEFSELVDYCNRASEFESEFGKDSLLDLDHPSVAVLIENAITPGELNDIRFRQNAISQNTANATRAHALRNEARRFS